MIELIFSRIEINIFSFIKHKVIFASKLVTLFTTCGNSYQVISVLLVLWKLQTSLTTYKVFYKQKRGSLDIPIAEVPSFAIK